MFNRKPEGTALAEAQDIIERVVPAVRYCLCENILTISANNLGVWEHFSISRHRWISVFADLTHAIRQRCFERFVQEFPDKSSKEILVIVSNGGEGIGKVTLTFTQAEALTEKLRQEFS